MLTTSTFSGNLMEDPTFPYPALVDAQHPKGIHGSDDLENANALFRESWSSLDDDFYLVTTSLLDDGAACGSALESNSVSHEVVDMNNAPNNSSAPLEKENTVEMSTIKQLQNIIASCFGHVINSKDRAPFVAFASAPLVSFHGTAVTPPVAMNLPFNVTTTAPTCFQHNPLTMMPQQHHQSYHQQQQVQHQQDAAPFVTTSIAKRLRLEIPFVAAAEPQGVLSPDQFVEADPTGSPGAEAKKTQAQMERRRERNRIHARRTRLRNKSVMETLNIELMELQRENTMLKAMARIHLNEDQSQRLLESCDAMENLPVAAVKACGANMLQQVVTHVKMLKAQNCLGVTDAALQDCSTATSASNGYFVMMG